MPTNATYGTVTSYDAESYCIAVRLPHHSVSARPVEKSIKSLAFQAGSFSPNRFLLHGYG